VDTPIETVKAIIDETGINILQFHGQESPEYCQEWSLPVIKSFSIQDENSLANIEKYQVFAYLMDTFAPNSPGGTGKTFDWGFIDDINPNLHLILAGGLNPGNAARAICRVRPFAVDVSSGVETSGRKDHGLIHEFVRQAQIDCAKRQDNCERW
jgi:phosphoribosylanthranilate isomerase